jgi:lipid-A-disaccharide synthase
VKFFLIAGERSGDLHGSNLIKELKILFPQSKFEGMGGELMESQGMKLRSHYSEYNVMGFVEVLVKVRSLRRYILTAESDIKSYQPDVLVLIDFGGFNMRIAKRAKAMGIWVVYYIPPKVWAWNTGRANSLKENVDQLLSILPFEKAFYNNIGWDIDFVGNPVNDAVTEFLKESKEDHPNKKTIALLPGSREQELKKTTPLFLKLLKRYPDYQFRIAGVKNLPYSLYEPYSSMENAEVIFDSTYEIL